MKTNKQELFESLHTDYFAMVMQMCLGFSQGDSGKASDLTQEVFIKVWTHLDSFQNRSSYKTWIYRITVNTCLQLIKKEKKKSTISVDSIQHKLTSETESEISEARARLYHAIGQLKKVDRLVIMMVLEGQEYDDIAEVLGIQPTNLRVKIHRIKKRLKNILDHE